MWQTVLQYLGIVLAVIILIAVIAFVIYKKTHKDRVEVILVRQKDEEEEEYTPKRNFVHPKPAPPQAAPQFHPHRSPFGPGTSIPSQPTPLARPPQPMGTVG